MRKLHVLSAFALVLTCAPAFADGVSSVGLRPDQEFSPKTVALEVNPIAAYAQASYGITDHFTLGPSVSLLRAGFDLFSDTTVRGYSAGLQGTFYLSGPRFTDGWVICPYGGYYFYNVHDSVSLFNPPGTPATVFTGDARGAYAGAVGGYQWVWSQLLSATVGLGFTAYSHGHSTILGNAKAGNESYSSLYGGVMPTILANVGVIF